MSNNDIVNSIICADVLDGLKQIASNSVALVWTSPPYAVGIEYKNRDDNQEYQEYLNWLKKVFIECKRILKKGGRLVVNIDAMTNRQDDQDQEYVRCIYAHLYNMMKEIGLKFRTEICWYKQNAVGKATSWGSWDSCSNPVIRRNHEYCLVWSKDQWVLEGDPELSDMTAEEFCLYTLSTWHILPETQKLGGHPCPFPVELAKRIIKLFSYRGDLIVDPFNGIGTSTYVAKVLGRNFIGIDNCKDYCDYARERLLKADSLFVEKYIPRSERLKNYKQEQRPEEKAELF